MKIGSLFAGIGGFELGFERAFPNAETIWQVEQNKFCQKILKKHWPNSKIYNDVREINKANTEIPDVILGGFPCQSISIAGKMEGLSDENKSGLWWEFWRIISDLRPRIAVLENVPNILRVGGVDVVGSLAQIGYDCRWQIISAKQFGAPHLRKRWFCICWPSDSGGLGCMEHQGQPKKVQPKRNKRFQRKKGKQSKLSKFVYSSDNAADSNNITGLQTHKEINAIRGGRKPWQKPPRSTRRFVSSYSNRFRPNEKQHIDTIDSKKTVINLQINPKALQSENYWKTTVHPPPLCGMDDGVPNRVDRLKALGNAIVPQCSEYIANQVREMFEWKI